MSTSPFHFPRRAVLAGGVVLPLAACGLLEEGEPDSSQPREDVPMAERDREEPDHDSTDSATSSSDATSPDEGESDNVGGDEDGDHGESEPMTMPREMPDLVGLTESQARSGLPEDITLTVTTTITDDPALDGRIMESSPAAGELVQGEAAVTIGEALAAVPLIELDTIDDDDSFRVGTFHLAGERFPDSLMMDVTTAYSSRSSYTLNLGKKFEKLSFALGIDDNDDNLASTRIVKILLDQVEVWTAEITFGQVLAEEIPLTDKLRLEIVLTAEEGRNEIVFGTPTLWGTKQKVHDFLADVTDD